MFLKYEFVYRKNTDNQFSYDSFVRQTDRPINLQKQEINALLSIKFEKMLLNRINISQFRFTDNIIIKFQMDDEFCEILGVGMFPSKPYQKVAME
jgi:hypothetical protein